MKRRRRLDCYNLEGERGERGGGGGGTLLRAEITGGLLDLVCRRVSYV